MHDRPCLSRALEKRRIALSVSLTRWNNDFSAEIATTNEIEGSFLLRDCELQFSTENFHPSIHPSSQLIGMERVPPERKRRGRKKRRSDKREKRVSLLQRPSRSTFSIRSVDYSRKFREEKRGGWRSRMRMRTRMRTLTNEEI